MSAAVGSAPLWPSLASGPGPQDGLGQGGLRLKWAKGRFGSTNYEKVKVLGMEFSVVENLSEPQESILSLSRSPQRHFRKQLKKMSNIIKFFLLPLLAKVGPMAVWGLGLLLCAGW